MPRTLRLRETIPIRSFEDVVVEGRSGFPLHYTVTTRGGEEMPEVPHSYNELLLMNPIIGHRAQTSIIPLFTDYSIEAFVIRVRNEQTNNSVLFEITKPRLPRGGSRNKFVTISVPRAEQWVIPLPENMRPAEGMWDTFNCDFQIGKYYIGTIMNGSRFAYNQRLGRLPELHPAVQAFKWVFAHLKLGTLPATFNLMIWAGRSENVIPTDGVVGA